MRQPKGSFSLFLVIWTGQLLSRLGSGLSAFALGVTLFQRNSSASAYSSLLLCAFLPSVLLAPVGGVLADREDRKVMMALGDTGSALGILFIILMLEILPDKDWPIYLGVATSSLFVALHSPAFKASVTDLLDEREYARASGLIQLAEASRYLLAPALAAFLISRVSLPVLLGIDAATFVVAALSLTLVGKSAIRPREKAAHEGFGANLSSGLHSIAGNGTILNLLCLTTVVTFFTGILQALFAPVVLSFSDPWTLGAVQSIGASGMILSSLLIGTRGRIDDQKKVLALSLLGAGIFYVLIGASTNAVMITLAGFCLFLTLPLINTSLEVLFRQEIPNGVQGRVWSLVSLVSQTGMLLAFGVAGLLADHLFNPLLADDGLLANSLGRLFGTGAARGSGLLIVISGLCLGIYGLFAAGGGRMTKDRNADSTVSEEVAFPPLH